MKKKLIIFPGNFLPNIGGLETHVDEFSKYLSKNKDYEITIFTPRVNGGKEKETIHNNVKVIRYPAFYFIPNFPMPKYYSLKFWKSYFSLYKKDYNIVMTRTRFFKNSFLGTFFAKFRINRIKLIHVEHGSSFVSLESKFKTKMAYIYDQIIGRLIFKLSDVNICVSETSHRFVKRYFLKKEKVQIIKRGVDFELYKSNDFDKEIKERFKDKIVITFLGRLFKWKSVSKTIKAYESLPKNLKDKCVLLIVGDGEDYDRLRHLSKEDLDKGIYMLGSVSFERAIKILNSTDIYVHSSSPGGALSNSLLQAMITKCAIVASPHEGAREVIINSQNGILLEDNTVEHIKEAITKLIKSKSLRDKYSKEANKYILNNFNWKNSIKQYEKVFEEVLR